LGQRRPSAISHWDGGEATQFSLIQKFTIKNFNHLANSCYCQEK
jgi:hypothetical protein